MSVKSNSNIGGVSAILIVLISGLSFINILPTLAPSLAPGFSAISFLVLPLGLVALILFFVSMNGLSHDYRAPAIFNNALYSVLSVIVGIFVVFAVFLAMIFFNLSNLTSTFNPSQLTSSSFQDDLRSVVVYIIPVFAAGAVVGVISMLFLRRSFNALADRSDVPKFRTAGTLFPVSAVVAAAFLILGAGLFAAGTIGFTLISVVVLPSGVVQLAAWILATQSYFELKKKARESQSVAPSQPAYVPPTVQVKYCPNCGAQNKADAVYCTRCGKQI